MKKKELSGLKNKEVKDLKKLFWSKKLDVQRVKMNIAAGKEKNLKSFKNMRRDIAQIATVIKEKEIVAKIQSKEGGED